MFVLLALLIIVAIYSGFFNKSESVSRQVTHFNQKTINMLFESDIKQITEAINSFFSDRGRSPELLAELIPDYLKTKNDFLDPWGTPYKIDFQDENNMTIISAGNDRTFETSDDLKRRLK